MRRCLMKLFSVVIPNVRRWNVLDGVYGRHPALLGEGADLQTKLMAGPPHNHSIQTLSLHHPTVDITY